ncbi:MAG TPA: hypothetical protein DCE42_22145 [Myxococcales bacterium]|nr:hypothetical protein [Deltaproteobacteria bacterium]HAA57483.1 hypothetical protein [Myxococcales bacterium]
MSQRKCRLLQHMLHFPAQHASQDNISLQVKQAYNSSLRPAYRFVFHDNGKQHSPSPPYHNRRLACGHRCC